MKHFHSVLAAIVLCAALAVVSRAQMGMDFFKRPAIASAFNPIVGTGGVYEKTRGQGDKDEYEVLVVGKDTAEGKEAYWLEMTLNLKGMGPAYTKALISKDDFVIYKSIFQIPGHPAMEMNANTSRASQRNQEEMGKFSQVGTETITVPAGTFSCQHWKKSDGSSDVWVSDKVAPVGMVKEVSGGSSEVLVKVITDAKDHITGPVSPFDPMLFRQIMMQGMQQNH